jgi:hypothetical protein
VTEIRIPYPFCKVKVDIPTDTKDYNRIASILSWRPGVTIEHDGYGDTSAGADAMGFMVVKELSRHRPSPKHMERVFFLRHFINPDDIQVSKPRLMMTTVAAFERLKNGYRYDFELAS